MRSIQILLQYSLTLLAGISINFLLPRIAPGSPLDYLLSEDVTATMSEAELQKVLAEFGLDLPLYQQYFNYLTGIFQGDFGISVQMGQPVWDILIGRLPWTLFLMGLAMLFSTLLGTALGVLSAWKRGKMTDITTLTSVLLTGSLPSFWLAMLLIILFSTSLRWLPSFGAYELGTSPGSWDWYVGVAERAVMPVLALSLYQTANILLIARSSLMMALEQDYILFARSKGVGRKRVFFKHVLRNALLPIYTNVMLGLGSLVGGALVIETVFAYPSMGDLIVNGVSSRDYNLLQGVFVFATVSIILANLLTDLFYPLIDPRTRHTV